MNIPSASGGSTFTATATCGAGAGAGAKAISGGGTVTNTAGNGKQFEALTESKPSTATNPTAWMVTATVGTHNLAGGGTVTAYVLCAS